MSEERLDRLEALMGDLIKMMGQNNAILMETRNDVAELKSDVAVLKSDVAILKLDLAELKRNQELFRDELFSQSARIDENKKILINMLSESALNANYAVSMVNKHDKEIFAIKERLSL